VHGRFAGELGAGELHAVAGISGEADDRVLEVLGGAGDGFRHEGLLQGWALPLF
jgi:hypothetical protein